MGEIKRTVLIVDDDEFSLENIELSLSPIYNVIKAVSYKTAVKQIQSNKIDFAIVDLFLPKENGLEIFKFLVNNKINIPFILITGYSDEASIIESLRLGVNDILKKPYDEIELHNAIKRAFEVKQLEKENQRLREKLEKENVALKNQIQLDYNDRFRIVGKSPKLIEALNKAKKIAQYEVNVILVGETGTGKELLARYIHKNSKRKDKPFIAVNCAELTPSLFESELFGYRKGAFTNANENRAGLVEAAHGGILFLDEITEIPKELQAKLLRVIESQKIRRIGDSEWMDIDVIFISSTNRTVQEILGEKFLREDLFHRLASTQINLPPLRERPEDIDDLANYFIECYGSKFNFKVKKLPKKIIQELKASEWRGNIRQFSNFIRNWCLFGATTNEKEIIGWMSNGYKNLYSFEESFKFRDLNFEEISHAKEWMINKVIKIYAGNKTKAAEHLGISYAGLLKMMKKLNK